MKKTLLLFFISYSFFAQEKDNSQQINLLNSNYKDFVLNQDKIFSITKNDSLIVWNYKNDSILLIKENVLAIAKNTKNEIYIASRNEIKNLSSSKLISSTQDSIYNILFDKKDNLIAITSKAVNYKNKRYFPPKYTSFYRKPGRLKYRDNLIMYDVLYLDSENRIWFGYNGGEWGGRACFFDLTSRKFYCDDSLSSLYYDKYLRDENNESELLAAFPNKIKFTKKDTLIKFPHNLYVSNIQSVTQDKEGSFYISESLDHFGSESNITKIERTQYSNFYRRKYFTNFLDDNVYKEALFNGNTVEVKHQEYLGIIKVNPFNNLIYFYTNNGFFTLKKHGKEYIKSKIINPKLIWKFGQIDAVGYEMVVKKIEFIDSNRFVFLTLNNGIGYYDGDRIKYFK